MSKKSTPVASSDVPPDPSRLDLLETKLDKVLTAIGTLSATIGTLSTKLDTHVSKSSEDLLELDSRMGNTYEDLLLQIRDLSAPKPPVLITISPSCPPSPLISTPLFHILPSQLFSSYTTIKPDIPLSISKACISDKLSIIRLVPYDNHCAQPPTIPRPLPWPTFLTSFIEFSLRPLPWPNILISFLELCRLPLKSQFCLLSHASSL